MLFLPVMLITAVLILKPNSVDAQQPPRNSQAVSPTALRTVFEWRELEFRFPSSNALRTAILDQSYIRGTSVPIDIDVYYSASGSPTYFVTIPRFGSGRPMTLATIMTDVPPGRGGPFLQPYPDYSWHVNPSKCEGMVSVFRVTTDCCARLWVLDTGKIGTTQLCTPQLLLFDLKSNRLLQRHRFVQSLYRDTSIFANPIVADVRGGECNNTFIYICDVQESGLIVYDLTRNVSRRINYSTFYPYPSSGTQGMQEQLKLMNEIIGMTVYALASMTENRVANILNEDMFLACWLASKAYGEPNIRTLARNVTSSQFTSGAQIVMNPRDQNNEELWFVTNRFQRYVTGILNSASTNFRILVADPKQLSRGTVCEPKFIPKNVVQISESSFFVPVNIVPDQVNYFS